MTTIDVESSAVRTYLGFLQAIVNRMAGNSASCKTWCITLVSAIIVFASDKSKPDAIWIAVVPVALCFLLDSYYLGLERQFRAVYNAFIRKLHSGAATVEDVYAITPRASTGGTLLSTAKAFLSISVWPFYGLICVMLAILRTWIF